MRTPSDFVDRFAHLHREAPGDTLRAWLDADLDHLPLPGHGRTLARWRALAAVAAIDLSLAKLYEGHTDALAILAELGADAPPRGLLWGTWCAEPPDARVAVSPDRGDANAGVTVHLSGRKSWCSGATQVDHAVVSGWLADGRPVLAAVAMDQVGVTVTHEGWHAVGMRGSGSVDVLFDHARATLVGTPGSYTARPGFWHGGAGIAACWYGGATAIARAVAAGPAERLGEHGRAHLGAIDIALAGARSALIAGADAIDAEPSRDARMLALRLRLVTEAACREVVDRAGRALGAGPLCRDASFAQRMADLPVFLRQSHAERDLAALGDCVRDEADTTWLL